MEVREAIRTKRAVRQFADKSVPREDILAVLQAGRRAQSSKNTQPWQFVVVQDRTSLVALSKTGDFAGHLAGAAFAVVLVSNDQSYFRGFDLGQAAAYMQLEAWSIGIGSCIATIYEPDKAKTILNIPSELSVNVALSFGYPSPDFVPAKMGGRKPLEALAHWEKW
jgi:nitroreductase